MTEPIKFLAHIFFDWYIPGMAKAQKTPQEKKSLELTKDHFTRGFHSTHSFHKKWKQKKAHANRVYRRKSEKLLAPAKPGISAEEVSLVADDLTAAHFRKSVIRKPLYKAGTITVGEKIKLGLEKREQRTGRRVQRREVDHRAASSAISTLVSLEGEELVEFVRRVGRLCAARDVKEEVRLQLSKDPLDQALHFICRIHFGSNAPAQTVWRDQQLHKAYAAWVVTANRILMRDMRVIEEKAEQKHANEKKIKAIRRATQ
ncbi:MAG: hypothetical protein WBQ94_06155 [Terracidiphilus sp.]